MSDKITTGSTGLDEVLYGGVPANTIAVLMGAPGTGKTILAEQLAFANATPESRVLYLTTLSEPLEKFIAHGQSYNFFDVSKIGSSVFYEDLGLLVRERGISKFAEILTNLLIAHRPKFVFIDSFKALNELLVDPREQRTVIYDVASVLTSYECTSFLIGEYSQQMMTELPEFAMADVVLQMIKFDTNVREQRFIRVEKMRGSASMPGMHAFSITEKGITVFPRLFTPQISANYLERLERVETGIPGLDEMISGGFWRGSTTLIAGPTGSGKTIIGLNFICKGATNGEPGLYIGLQENPIQIARTMKNFGWRVEELLDSGNFELMYRSPVELQLDSVTAELLQRVRQVISNVLSLTR
jgi:circadian clock protein KaiC